MQLLYLRHMRIIHTCIALAFALACAKAHGQIAVFTKDPQQGQSKELDPEVLAAFKATTTVFFLREGDDVEAWRKALAGVWTFNTLELRSYSEMDRYDEAMKEPGGYSFMTIMAWMNQMEVSMWMPWPKKSWVGDQKLPIIRCGLLKLDTDSTWFTEQRNGDLITKIYQGAPESIWRPHVFANLLRVMNDGLVNSRKIEQYEKRFDVEVNKGIRGKPLFVVNTALGSGKYYDDGKPKKKVNFMKGYTGSYEVISMDELERKLASGEDFNYLYIIRTWLFDHLLIQHSTDGALLYTDIDQVERRDEMYGRMVDGKKPLPNLIRR